jgi:hypothetical protein
VDVGVGEDAGVLVHVAVGEGVQVLVGVDVGMEVDVLVARAVCVGADVAVNVGLETGVFVGWVVAVAVGVFVGVGLCPGVFVGGGAVAVAVGGTLVGVAVGFAPGSPTTSDVLALWVRLISVAVIWWVPEVTRSEMYTDRLNEPSDAATKDVRTRPSSSMRPARPGEKPWPATVT